MGRSFFILFLALFLLSSLFAQHDEKSDLLIHKEKLFKSFNFTPKPENVRINQNKFDALFYELHLTIDYDNQQISGLVEADFKVKDKALDSVFIDLKNNMAVSSITGNVSNFERINDQIKIYLDRTYSEDEQFNFVINYTGSPLTTNYYFNFDTAPDGSKYVWTLSEPYGAHYWWPSKDTPADKADSVSLYFTVPDNQIVGSNGTRVSVNDNQDGTKTFHWFEKYPIATYLVSIVAGSYVNFTDYYHYSNQDSMLLDYYVFPEQLEIAKTGYSEMSDYLDALSYYFGPYPFLDEKYGQAVFGRGGGMEHQTLTSVGSVNLSSRYLYVHELGHQWFGDAVTCASWTDIWLNEGFASYSEALYAEWAGVSNLEKGFESYQAYMISQYYSDGGTIYIQDTTEVSNIFDIIVYHKGSWVLHMLRHIVGDEIFFDILKSYVYDMRWQYGSVSTEDFLTVCEEKSGMELDWFFEQWLYYPYYPRYIYDWSTTEETGSSYKLDLSILQQQTQVVYRMPIDVLILFSDGSDSLIVVDNYQSSQNYSFIFEKEAVEVLLDPDYWILSEKSKEEEIIKTYKIRFQHIYPNPMVDEVNIYVTNPYGLQLHLNIYNSLGQKVRTLYSQSKGAYYHFFDWDGCDQSGVPVASGVYFAQAADEIQAFRATGKIIVVR